VNESSEGKIHRCSFGLVNLSGLLILTRLTDHDGGDLIMATSTSLTPDVQAELTRRHKATARTVVSLLVAVILLCVLAFVSQKFLTQRNNPSLDIAVRVSILIFGLGAIALRRTKFAKMRLQDIAALQGASGLLVTLQRTTLRVALIGIAIAVIGFVSTLATGTPLYTYQSGVVAAAVLLYCYPVRASWEQAVKRFSPAENGSDSLEIPS
jgi:peptidoglycan/LPS O-acetylase OafA/YrhL